MNQFQIEPSADQRTGAKQLRGMYLAFIEEGFTQEQAITLIGAMFAKAAE